MASNAKATLIKRLASTPGRGNGANTGLGTADVVIPDFPQLPQKLNDATVREFSDAVNRWRISLQAQFPIPTQQAAVVTEAQAADVSDQISGAIQSAVASINSQIDSLNQLIVSNTTNLQNQIDSISTDGGVTVDEVESLIQSARYIHTQGVASASWTINHGLGWFPSVTVVDQSKNVFYGDVRSMDSNSLVVTFYAEVSGPAYLN
jgi:hypothetical protein